MKLSCSFFRAAWNIHVISIENLRQNPTISSWKLAFCGLVSTCFTKRCLSGNSLMPGFWIRSSRIFDSISAACLVENIQDVRSSIWSFERPEFPAGLFFSLLGWFSWRSRLTTLSFSRQRTRNRTTLFDFHLILSYTGFWTTRDYKILVWNDTSIIGGIRRFILTATRHFCFALILTQTSGNVNDKYGRIWLVWIRGNFELKITRFVKTPWHYNMGVSPSNLGAPALTSYET